MKRTLIQLGLAAVLLLPLPLWSAELDATEQAMANWIDDHSEDAIALVAETVNISSGTMNHDGVRAVGAVLRRELDAIGLETEWIDMPPEMNRTGHLVAQQDGGRGKKILMIGHLDTVYDASDKFQAWSRDGNTATGPGTDDMKSGNVVMVYALKALQAAGQLDGMPVFVIYTGDEELRGEEFLTFRTLRRIRMGWRGMGPIGKGAHTPNESLNLDSMPVAIKRAAILMYRLSQQ